MPEKAAMLMSLKSSGEWFIADTEPLNTKFRGLIPLLDIKVDDLTAMHQLGQQLDLGKRLLSKEVSNIPRTSGLVELDQELTDTLRSKVDFIIRLLPTTRHYRQTRRTLIKQLRNIEVYTAHAVVQESQIYCKGKWVKAPADTGNVAIFPEDDVLKIYLAAKSGFNLGEIELADELFSYCSMKGENPRQSEMCLHVALSQKDLSRIEKLFADKGIPSLESLGFADAEESESERRSEDESSGEGSDGKKKKFRPFGDLSVGEVILGIPVGIAVGIGGLLKDRRCFDGKSESDAWETTTNDVDKESKEEPPDYEDPQTETSDEEPSESGPNGLQRLGKAVSYRLRCLTIYNEDIAFQGEFEIHKTLTSTLGKNYNPQTHWLSPLRTRVGLPPPKNTSSPSFTFQDVSGTFTQLLAAASPDFAGTALEEWVAKPPTYHLDVRNTRSGTNAEFEVTEEMMGRARRGSVVVQRMRGVEVPREVYVLVRVFDLEISGVNEESEGIGKGKERVEGGKMMFLVDPWEAFCRERLVLRAKGGIVGALA
ncbi:hypothetical protein L207DRAFT_573917 [Hyaloscypha variabilis F]|uniref:Uncharacterized protein n=1 Tax=Hyaloscypha variabilis (strain UAMH 11265 / GT02V1 / F) TaxID=1149755 RepID=A0A2J6QUP1_HYAVF|nr:hypothetical protein L207DRAFT_573917 [Hyaloscypha variabilis F]